MGIDKLNRFYENVYYTSLGLGALFDVYEALYEINNFKQKLTEGAKLGTPQQEQTKFNLLIEKATDAIHRLNDRVALSSDNVMQQRFEAAEEVVIKVIEQQYKMTSDTKTQNYDTIITNCGNALSQLIQNTFRRAFLNANKTIYHINGKQVTANDFTMDFYMKIASKKTGINFKTLLVA